MRSRSPPRGNVCAGGWSSLRLALAAVVAATLLGGCVIRVVYNQLDWLTLWYVEDYVDLDRAQKEQAQNLIAHTLSWHRATQLPRYASLAREILAGSDSPVSATFVAAWYAEVVKLLDALLRQVCPDVAALLKTLSDKQVIELFAQLAEENEELEDEYSGAESDVRRIKQEKAIVKVFRRFTGRLTPGQEALIHSATEQSHDLSADWLRRRAAWQQEFRVLMDGRKSDPDFEARFTDLVLNPNQFDSPGYRDLVLDNQQRFFRLVAEVLRTLSPAQEKHLKRRLTIDAGDFDALVRSGNQQPEGQ